MSLGCYRLHKVEVQGVCFRHRHALTRVHTMYLKRIVELCNIIRSRNSSLISHTMLGIPHFLGPCGKVSVGTGWLQKLGCVGGPPRIFESKTLRP